MKIFIAPLNYKMIKKSGIGRAILHQKQALSEVGIDYIDNPKEDFDIIHANTYDFGSLYHIYRAKKMGKKVIIHAHSTQEDFENSFFFSNWVSPVFKNWIVFFYNRADLILTPTPYSKSLIESYDIRKPIIDISNGVKLENFKPNSSFRKEFRDKYGIREDRKLILTVGFPIERKGIEDFVKLASQMPDCDFLWCGALSDYLLPAKVKKLMSTRLPNLHFPGYVSDIHKAYQAADIFFMPSYEETEGIVMLEALASRTPIVCRNIPAFQPWLEDGKSVVMGNNVYEFKEAIESVLAMDDGDMTSMLDIGYSVAEARSINLIAKKLESIYSKLLSDRG